MQHLVVDVDSGNKCNISLEILLLPVTFGLGLLVFLGIHEDDETEDVAWLSQKIAKLRIFSDLDGKMNLSMADLDAELLLISQFTLHAQTKKGNRPSFINAAKPSIAMSGKKVGDIHSPNTIKS